MRGANGKRTAAGLAQSIPLQVEALGTVRLRDLRVADQHWRLQNNPDCVKTETRRILRLV